LVLLKIILFFILFGTALSLVPFITFLGLE
jgi:hypothetical protein